LEATLSKSGVDWNTSANTALKSAATFWFLVAMIGQWLFVYFIVAFYYSPTLQGNFEAWSRNKMLPHGYVPGDTIGNLMFAIHVLLAAVLTLGGTMQLIPQLRARFPAVHRWTGRTFFVTALALSFGGLFMVWVNGRSNNIFGALSISLNAMLIIFFSIMAWKSAMARNFAVHRRWALRAYIVASGVWFLRLGYMAWIIINQGPVGIGKNGTGPFDILWGFGMFLLPLAILEIYLRAKDNGSSFAKFATAGGLVLATLVMGIGIFGAFNAFWRPLL
jgi:Predicted membrane protein (DUF2306)